MRPLASAGRIVNVSSTMGSLADQTDPASPYVGMVLPAYQASKVALNSVTIGLSKLLADTPIKVKAVCPGFVQTDLTPISREQAPLTADAAAHVAVRYALLDENGPEVQAVLTHFGGFIPALSAISTSQNAPELCTIGGADVRK